MQSATFDNLGFIFVAGFFFFFFKNFLSLSTYSSYMDSVPVDNQVVSRNPAGRTPQLFRLSERKKTVFQVNSDKSAWDIAKMLPRHYQILDLFIQGKSNAEIAEVIGISKHRVSRICNAPAFQDQLSRRRRSLEEKMDQSIAVGVLSSTIDVHKQLKKLSERAVSKLGTLLESEDENVQFRSAADILDRSGFAKVSRLESESKASVVVLDAALIQMLKNTLDEDRDDYVSADTTDSDSTIETEPVEEVEENLEKPVLIEPSSPEPEGNRFVSP
jgi:hypothetical protein